MKLAVLPKNINQYLQSDVNDTVEEYLKRPADDIYMEGAKMALDLFHQAAERVPAYKKFLKVNNIKPESINTTEDFKNIPFIDKKNYLRAYPLNELCWDGELKNQYILSSSSGSTGEPFLWPRGEQQELEGAATFEVIFKEFFNLDKLSTLYIDCFAMGTWIAGPFVLACAEYLTRKDYNILSVTPGIDKDIAIPLFTKLAPKFDQIVISGYPPLIKDLLDAGEERGIRWKDFRIKFLFAAEGFSEEWREFVHRKVGARDEFTTSINLYGSADAAILAHETPLTTYIRKIASNKKSISNQLFKENRMPTLAQYDPRAKFFEAIANNLIFTTPAGIPLVRYNIGDTGGVYTYSQMHEILKWNDINYDDEIKKINKRFLWNLPFVYVFGRSDFTVSFYGLLIYPEHIKYCLEREGLDKYISGKFVMTIEHDQKQNQHLVILVELKNSVKATKTLAKELQTIIVRRLRRINTEYGRLFLSIKDAALPEIRLIENGNTEYFRPGAKQRWVRKP